MIGKFIGNYQVQEKLGEGGMGAVYKGIDTMLDREVAIKALRPELASQTSVVERFRSEAVTLAKLNHPNIAALYTMFRQGAELYMVLEFVRGETLDSIIQRRGAMPAAEVIPVFCQILDGIDHAHELGIVHRDIKPANMMLTENGKLKVLDFGIARLLGSARMTRAGNIIGTLEYMAPEQVKGQETDGRSDIYALGMMLYEILTGKLPFDTENEFELMKSQTEMLPTSPRAINPNIPEEVEAAIMQAIQKNPDERFQTAGEFRATLLDAGFKAHGTMHGVQRPGYSPNDRRSAPPRHSGARISFADGAPTKISSDHPANSKNSADNSYSAQNELPLDERTLLLPERKISAPENLNKETRLGAQEEAFGNSFGNSSGRSNKQAPIKETKLGEPVSPATFQNDNPSNTGIAASGFSAILKNLNWIHYAAGSFIVVMLLGLLLVIPFYFLRRNASGPTPSTGSLNNPPAVSPEAKDTGANQQILNLPHPASADVPESAGKNQNSSGGSNLPNQPDSPSLNGNNPALPGAVPPSVAGVPAQNEVGGGDEAKSKRETPREAPAKKQESAAPVKTARVKQPETPPAERAERPSRNEPPAAGQRSQRQRDRLSDN